MRVEKEIKVPARVVKTPAKVKKTVKIVCDFCGVKLPDHGSYGHYWSCDCCGRDTCRKHQQIDDHGDDHPDWYCLICYDLYMPEKESMQERHWREEESLKRNIKRLSLAKETTNG